ncbi:MAG: hypothetical protein NTZ34_12450 [Chloroflexi bacterium]|nr:hypothetical protein [Chloroflexota bacterium]
MKKDTVRLNSRKREIPDKCACPEPGHSSTLVSVTKLFTCPDCDEIGEVKGIGRKSLTIPRKNVCEAIQTHRSVAGAAQELGCSQAYIFHVLKTNGLTLMDVFNGWH